jgi:putative ubiquitin-RnfH superfamily antitoxin RatB of RatAB toxin-antitoxin module
MQITLIYSPAPREVFEQTVSVSEGATAADVVLASDLGVRYPDLDWRALPAGVWGRTSTWEHALKDQDRVELCRPLKIDPKVARRERFKGQGARGTGLFANRRTGGKAGY